MVWTWFPPLERTRAPLATTAHKLLVSPFHAPLGHSTRILGNPVCQIVNPAQLARSARKVDPLPTLCATLVTFAHKAPLALSRNLALRGHILEPLAALLRARV